MPKPPEKEDKALTWPDWPLKLRTSSSHEEGVDRDWAVLTKRVIEENGVAQGSNACGSNGKTAACRKWPTARSRSRPT